MDWKKVGAIATFGGFGYWAYKLYTESKEREQKRAREEREEYAQQERERAAKFTEQKLLQERLIEEVEAPFMRYCDAMSGFSFGRGFLELKEKLEQGDKGSREKQANKESQIDKKIASDTDCPSWISMLNPPHKPESLQKMREINAYIESFSPTQDELLKVLSLGQEMFDRVSKAKPFAQFIQASKSSGETTQEAESEQNTPSDMAKELIKLYEAAITSLSGDKEQIVWGGGCIFPIIPSPIYDKLSDTKWRHQWLFNTGLTLPLQVCMMKHLQSVFGIEPANFSTALSKLAKDAAYKYRIIGLDYDKDDEPKTHISSVSGFMPVPIKIHQQTPRAMKSGIYAYILHDIGREYSRLLVESNGDKAKLESSIEAWDSAALTL
ncbi:hypothetical protein NYG90_06870 [Helicobacter sp. XJK30-2]|uniref:Uncharacterized protein n=1 Tax=Helicobacter zhangjianzhongii TaxID=2974574 RepID=A0ACC6FSY7_9HELI|nr:hypothetical protein [Helicobacter sp. XJK30-2]MDL0082389.1 hypothetical protein [Helicobacter sp. XJK30-2]